MPELFLLCKIMFAGAFVLAWVSHRFDQPAATTIGICCLILGFAGCLFFAPSMWAGLKGAFVSLLILGFIALGFKITWAAFRMSRGL